MKRVVILGAGTGGTIVANMLSHKLDLKEWQITVIDKAQEHIYQPGLLFLPFKLYGYDSRDDVVKDIKQPLPKAAQFVQAEIYLIDHQNNEVETSAGRYEYDWLISSLGCHPDVDEIDGLAEAMGKNAYTFYGLDSALAMQDALENMQSGKLIINIADVPIKCPVAPIEFAFLADYYFTLKGVRKQIEITLVTPYSGAFTKPVANRVLSKIAEEKNINVVADFALESVDCENKKINSFEGTSVDYDLLCIIPPNLGPKVMDESGLSDGTGYVLTEPRTLKARNADNIYVLGDNTNVSTSKAGAVAHFEAETIVENILREINGEKPLPSFDGHTNCFIESGYHKALLIDFNYDMEPLEGSFPLPHVGPFSLLQESYMNHVGKIAFKWVYWDMLLPGYLAHVPFLPSHMNFVGKNLNDAPQIRHSNELNIKDFMSSETITIQQGSPLSEAAKLMTQHHISSLPIVDVNNKLIGILTEGDLISALDINADSTLKNMLERLLRRRKVKKHMGTIVDDLMTPNPITIKSDDKLQRAVELMDKNKIKRLVVTNTANDIEGVVSRADMVRLFIMK